MPERLMRVLVLGCGPAGLIAAHAAAEAGAEVLILSKGRRKSRMFGAQYLHEPIPGIDAPQFTISYRIVGPITGYKRKVYGHLLGHGVSPETLLGESPAWDIRATYDQLWAVYGDAVEGWEASPGGLEAIRAATRPDVTISTIPAPFLCDRNHRFDSVHIWSTDVADGIEPEDNIVICSGREADPWYRKSRIQGWENTEYPHDSGMATPTDGQVWQVRKPISNNCDCFPDVIRLGRYGRWEKGVLSHEAYEETRKVVEI